MFTRSEGPAAGHARFRRFASLIMNNDGVSFVVLCVVTRQTLETTLPSAALIAVGVAMVLIGGAIKIWAARCLGPLAYYWADFFWDEPPQPLNDPGPYRYFRNPMYTVGYLPMYGAALIVQSWPALVAAVFAQLGILIFHVVVEKPHFERISGATARGTTPS